MEEAADVGTPAGFNAFWKPYYYFVQIITYKYREEFMELIN